MEQTTAHAGKRAGWTEEEIRLLWSMAEEAKQKGYSLRTVFERIAEETGRRPNSVRNYYYAQVRTYEKGENRLARFVPFTQQEVDLLMEQVLQARAQGQSVRACLQRLSKGDHSLMIRYQNKYSAVVKFQPEYVREMVGRLRERGVICEPPRVRRRGHPDGGAKGEEHAAAADREAFGRQCAAISDYLEGLSSSGQPEGWARAAQSALGAIRTFVESSREDQLENLDRFCAEMQAAVLRLGEDLSLENP